MIFGSFAFLVVMIVLLATPRDASPGRTIASIFVICAGFLLLVAGQAEEEHDYFLLWMGGVVTWVGVKLAFTPETPEPLRKK